MIFTFLYDEKEIELTNSNTRPIFSVISKETNMIELIKINNEEIKETFFNFYKSADNKILIPITAIKRNFYDKAVKYLAKTQNKNKVEKLVVLKEGNLELKKFEKEISTRIIKNKYIRGVVSYNKEITLIFRLVESFLVKTLLLAGYEQIILPKITPWNTWLKTGHLLSNHSEIMPISRTTPNKIQDLLIKAYFEDKDPIIDNKNIGGMTYSQCENFWSQIQGDSEIMIDSKKLNLFFDRSGPSYRQERKNISGIKRLSEFRRIEVIFLGSKTETELTVKKLIDMYSLVYEKLGFTPRISQVASWSDLKDGYSIDFEINFQNQLLETNNVSYNSNYYTKKFLNRNELYSGCSGIGLDRFVYSIISKYGIEESKSLLEKLLL